MRPPTEVCDDCTDNDGDGLVDLADPDCQATALLVVKATVNRGKPQTSADDRVTLLYPPGGLAPVEDTLMALLNASDRIWPVYFRYDEKRNWFAVAMPIRNRGINPRILRAAIEQYVRVLNENENHWNPKLWS